VHARTTPARSADPRTRVRAQVEEVDKRAGAVWHIDCDSRWANVFDGALIEYHGTSNREGSPTRLNQVEAMKTWPDLTATRGHSWA
jgi:hypothetical protein